MRDYISRVHVDKSAKVFNVADEFIVHLFKGHLIARICTLLHLNSPSDSITHEKSLEWLESTAKLLVADTLFPVASNDPVYLRHRTFLHSAFMYTDLRNSIRWENGPQIIRHWKWWIPRFLGTEKRNYATEATNLIVNISADFPRHISYIATHNRTVNMDGRPGHGKPIDQLMEHYNL